MVSQCIPLRGEGRAVQTGEVKRRRRRVDASTVGFSFQRVITEAYRYPALASVAVGAVLGSWYHDEYHKLWNVQQPRRSSPNTVLFLV